MAPTRDLSPRSKSSQHLFVSVALNGSAWLIGSSGPLGKGNEIPNIRFHISKKKNRNKVIYKNAFPGGAAGPGVGADSDPGGSPLG